MTIKIGCYVCHCGINIAGRVRVDEVSAYAHTLQGVIVSRDYKFMCSDPGQEMIEKDIREHGLNRVVVASCSPRLHEKTFQGACQRAGINPYLFQMASVREQVSWVTGDSDEATRKAKTLVAAAVNRVSFHDRLETRQVAVHPDVMVVGAGIAGMQAALDIGSAGNKVYLVEKAPTIGGHMLQFDKTFPTLDCAACIGTPKMVEVAQQANIQLMTYSEVTDVSGYIGNYKVNVHRHPRYVTEGVCTGCGECAKVCPITRPSEWDVGLQRRGAIYRSFPQAVPIAYVIDKRGTAPCKATCPAHVSIQGYIALINQGKYREALDLFREQHPFPGVCGRVCHHPCESNCSRNAVDQPLAIRELHRFLADWEKSAGAQATAAQGPTAGDQKVAIVGAGPAGLAAAYFLALKGYAVTVFEKLPVAGGMMAVGIPDYRLPRDVLADEIAHIEQMGVTIRTGVTFGEDITLEGLRQEGFGALFLALGLHGGRRLGVANEDAEGVLQGVDFLRDVSLGKPVAIGKEVLVIGGGNVAVDVALTAKRKGAAKVTMICLETRDQMPAWEHEIREALESDITIVNGFGPKAFFIDNGKRVSGLEFKACTSVFDEAGRFNPHFDEDACQPYFADTVIIAIGQSAQLDFAAGQKIAVNARGGLEVDPRTLQTPLAWVFAGGDAVYGPKSVVEAVACGKQAAESMHRFLNGLDLLQGPEKQWDFEKPDVTGEPLKERVPVRCLEPAARECNFLEVSMGYTQTEARKEAERCLECGICSECYQCEKVCQPKAIDHEMQAQDLEVKVGSIILATGFDLMDARRLKPYGYGIYPNVFTSLEFERLNNATGPTGGQILMRDAEGNFTRKPDSVAILNCMGSRDVNYHEYCSRVCCMYALKYSHLIKEKVGHDTPVYDFFIDQRCYGKGYEAFYRRCQEEGTTFIRGKVAELTDRAIRVEEEGKLIAVAEDTLLGRRIRVPVDMVVLCLAMEARADIGEVSRIFGVSQGADGFFLEEHPKLAPLSTATDGIFLAGACQGPKDIPDTVAQASGAAAKSLALAHRGVVEVPSAISWIDPDICAGCQVCIGLCPYGAIEFDPRRLVSEVNEALCKGCGSCAAFCPSNAAQVRHFRPGQVMAELEGIFDAIVQVGI